MADLQSELKDHCNDVVLRTAGRFQSWNSMDTCKTSNGSDDTPECNLCDKFGDEMLESIDCLSVCTTGKYSACI